MNIEGKSPFQARVAKYAALADPARLRIVDLLTLGDFSPMELQAEYPNGGAQSGADKLTLPREMVIGNLKRDVLTIRAAFAQSGTGLSI